MNRPKAYLSGPMRGYADFNFPAFHAAEERLTLAGLTVFSPARNDEENGFDFGGTTGHEDLSEFGFDLRRALGSDLAFICDRADMVVCLPGWEASSGATAEVAAALALGLLVFEYDEDATLTLEDWLRESIRVYTGDRPPFAVEDTPLFDGLAAALGEDEGEVIPELLALADRVQSRDEIRTTSLTGGQKGDKPARYDLIPARPLWQLAELYGAGARKYADRNWENGYAWHLSFAAMMRHAWLFWQGEDTDAETGAPHLTSVVFHAFALLEWAETHPEYDDRPKR